MVLAAHGVADDYPRVAVTLGAVRLDPGGLGWLDHVLVARCVDDHCCSLTLRRISLALLVRCSRCTARRCRVAGPVAMLIPQKVDPTTGEKHLRHHMTKDGYYKGRKVLDMEEAYEEE